MMNLIKKIFGKKVNKEQCAIDSVRHSLKPPKGWYVSQAGQDPLHMLWYVVLVSFDDVCDDSIEEPRHFIAQECDSFEQALKECISNCA